MCSEDSNISDEENYSDELGSDESSGKDWSDLEAEAAESDDNRYLPTEQTFICYVKHKSYHLISRLTFTYAKCKSF